jgi:biliverdin reductase
VRAVLDAGRHALVEFPLAPDAATAEMLFAHARGSGRVLHEEHIELLDAASGTLSAHIRSETVRHVRVHFEGPGTQDAPAAELALDNVARVHRVVAFAGPVAEVLRVAHADGQLEADLRLASGAILAARFRRAPYYVRRTSLEIETVAGRWTQEDDQISRDGMPMTLVGMGGLFSRDQRSATARMLDGAPAYVDELRSLHVMDVVDRLGRLAIGAVPQRSDAAASTG